MISRRNTRSVTTLSYPSSSSAPSRAHSSGHPSRSGPPCLLRPIRRALFLVDSIGPLDHLRLPAKSALVGASWIFGYFAVKHLPLSIAGPIRATSPIWTILFAVALMGERPATLQWAGIAVVLLAFYAFSFIGRLEGIRFHRNKWVGYMLAATLIGAAAHSTINSSSKRSACDLRQSAWFSIYLVLVLAPFALLWQRNIWPRGPFAWRWSIPLIGLALLVADFLYFTAITHPDALIFDLTDPPRCRHRDLHRRDHALQRKKFHPKSHLHRRAARGDHPTIFKQLVRDR